MKRLLNRLFFHAADTEAAAEFIGIIRTSVDTALDLIISQLSVLVPAFNAVIIGFHEKSVFCPDMELIIDWLFYCAHAIAAIISSAVIHP